jgi:hypothetical protein
MRQISKIQISKIQISKFGAAIAALLVVCGVIAAAQVASARDADSEITSRDTLIRAQEDLLNTYRCLFSVDMQLVPGGCDPDREVGLVPEVGVSGTGSGVRTASLEAGRYQVDISVAGPGGHFSVLANDSTRCELMANEIVEGPWAGSVVLIVGAGYLADCEPGDLLIEVDAPDQAAWKIIFTSR